MSTGIFWLCVIAAALPAMAQERRADLPVALYTSFEQQLPAAVLGALHNELENLMEPEGLHLDWRSLAGVSGADVAAELAVVKFQGRCDADGLVMRSVHPGALGWTHVSDGVILPFADVDCDRIRVFLQKELMFLRATDRAEAYGRAVARVVAHELYHIFTQTAHHAAEGIGKSAFSVQDLLSGDFAFDERESEMLRGVAVRVSPPAERTDAMMQ